MTEPRLDCWIWAGVCNEEGYGQIRVDGKYRSAHRIIYEALVGDIPKGLEPDHLCEVKTCINPDHIELVTHQENTRRGMAKTHKTHCKRGHELVEGNLIWSANQYGTMKRKCYICNKLRDKMRTRKLEKE